LAGGILEEKVKEAEKHLTECNLCPHNCGVNRKEQGGFCRSTDKNIEKVALRPLINKEMMLMEI